MKQIALVICFFVFIFGCTESEIKKPQDLKVIAASNQMIEIGWRDLSDNEDGFKIERSKDGEGFQEIYETVGNTQSFNDEGVLENSLYRYRLRAFNNDDHSGYSNTIEARAAQKENAPPFDPENLSVTYVTRSSVHLMWTDTSDNETYFRIERSTNSAFTEVMLVNETNHTYVDGDLLPGTEYFYRVVAVNEFGLSGYSNEVSARVLAENTIFPAPSDLIAESITQRTLTLKWTDNSENEEGFLVKRSINGGPFDMVATLSFNKITFEDAGLTADTVYSYTVEAFDGEILSESSIPLDTKTTPLPIEPPAAPLNLSLEAISHNQIRLSWADQSHNEAGFNVDVSTDGISYSAVGAVAENGVTFTHSGLTANTHYYYRVHAHNAAGVSSSIEGDTQTPPAPILVPQSPADLAAPVVALSGIRLKWTDRADNEEGFRVERSLNAQFTDAVVIDLNEPNQQFHEDTNTIQAETEYYYRVAAFNSAGLSDFSNEISVVTPVVGETVEAPTDLRTGEVTETSIQLVWKDNATNEGGFAIERSNDGTTFNEIQRVAADVTTFLNSGLLGGATYHYRVRAFFNDQFSAFSNSISATTNTPQPEPNPDSKFIADYTIAKESVLRRIPKAAIEQAKANLHIMYSGTSHSRQVMQGMRGLKEYKPGDDMLFNFTHRGGPVQGALDIDYNFDGKTAWDLSQDGTDANGHTGYFRDTVQYLDSHPSANVVMWSWCSIEGHDVEVYLKNFGELVDMYKAGGTKGRVETNKVTLIFMTGYARGNDGDTPESPYIKSPYQNHKRIIDFCKKNGYFCLDYWSQDTYNYADDSFKSGESGNANVQHHAFVTNPNNKLGEDWFECRNYINGTVQYPEHTADNASFAQHLTGNRRAYAAWWLFARIAGWDGALE